jgi:hypothetical protein
VCSLVRDGSYKVDVAYDGFGSVLDSWNMSTYTNFTWGGGHGYRQTGLAYSSVYVRARHYSNMDAGWTTIDPLWPSEMPYGYVNGRVPGGVDPSGMKAEPQCFVRRCDIYGWGRKWYSLPTHTFVCGHSPRKWCFGGLPHNRGYESKYGCKSKTFEGMEIKCTDLTTDCGDAAYACNCIRGELRENPPGYETPWNDPGTTELHVCYHFDLDVKKCACYKHKDSRETKRCLKSFEYALAIY